MSQSIQLCNVPGTSNICLKAWERELTRGVENNKYKIEKFDPQFTGRLDQGLKERNIALLIVPGGHSPTMIWHLHGEDGLVQKINKAIADRSSFLGSCAGAIVSSWPKPIRASLNFNPIPYHSKYYMPKDDDILNSENISAIEVGWMPSYGHFKTEECKLYHAFGPAFPLERINSEHRNNCRVLAMYKADGTTRKADNSAAAILYRPIDSTARLLTGVHPEIGFEDVRSEEFAKRFNGNKEHSHIVTLAKSLESSEMIRQQMCDSWFSELGIQLKPKG